MSIILQVNYTPSRQGLEETAVARVEAAERIASTVKGLQWKVWLKGLDESLRGGIYLFDDEESARAWGEGYLRQRLKEKGGTEIVLRYFEVDEEVSLITRASIRLALLKG